MGRPSDGSPGRSSALSPPRKLAGERFVGGRLHSVGAYEITGKLGEGTFGIVLKGVHVHVGEPVAIKVLEKSRITTADEIERVAREVSILKSTRHANVVRLWELLYTKDKIYLVMEFTSRGELFGHIVQRGRLSDDEARFYFRQALEGLEYLHSHGIVHRDIKPEVSALPCVALALHQSLARDRTLTQLARRAATAAARRTCSSTTTGGSRSSTLASQRTARPAATCARRADRRATQRPRCSGGRRGMATRGSRWMCGRSA